MADAKKDDQKDDAKKGGPPPANIPGRTIKDGQAVDPWGNPHEIPVHPDELKENPPAPAPEPGKP